MKTDQGHKCCKFILAFALAWMLCVFILGLLSGWTGYGNAMVFVLSSIYIGYSPTFIGSIIGAIWAFFDIIIFAAIVSLFYCLIAGRHCCKKNRYKDSFTGKNDTKTSLNDQARVNNE